MSETAVNPAIGMTNNKLVNIMPHMLSGEELKKRLLYLPPYSRDICMADRSTRLMELNDMADIYIPSAMTYEIYSKLYLSMLRAAGKKMTAAAVRQGYENNRRIIGKPGNSILGGCDSFSIIGQAGIGKSTAIVKSLEAAGATEIIRLTNPYVNVIPCINVQCPHDCSVKSMLFSILSEVDERLGTRYHERAVRSRATIDSLIGTVSQVAVNHILLLVVDECQNICRNKGGVNVVSALTQLINSSGISICLVGLPETELFFRREMHLARRSVGLSYLKQDCDDFFISFCSVLYGFQYVAHPREITPEIIETLYQCSSGIIGIVLSLLMEAQQVAILSDREELTKELLLETFQTRMKNVNDFVEVYGKKRPQTSSVQRKKTAPKAMPKEKGTDIPHEPEKGQIRPENAFQINNMAHAGEDVDTLLELMRESGFALTEVAV